MKKVVDILCGKKSNFLKAYNAIIDKLGGLDHLITHNKDTYYVQREFEKEYGVKIIRHPIHECFEYLEFSSEEQYLVWMLRWS